MQRVRFRDPAGSVRRGEWVDGAVSFADRTYAVEEVDVLPPTEPSKIVCVGRNYVEHAAESGAEVPDRPLLFLIMITLVSYRRSPSTGVATGGKE